MQGRTRRTVATGATVFVLAGSAVLGAPATASADTVSAQCGQTVTVKPGDKVQTPFGLQTITDGLTQLVGGLLGGLCQITVHVVDAVIAPVPVIGAPAAGAINGVVSGTTNGLTKATGDVGKALSGGGQPPKQGTQPPAQQPPKQGTPGAPGAPATGGGAVLPPINSPLVPGAGTPFSFGGLPVSFSGGYSPMRDYSNVPAATAGLYTPSPGVRYGGQIPGYAPEFGLLGQEGPKQPDGVQNAGRAEALPSGSSGLPGGVGLPVLLAVVALSGASAGLVRTWVLRKTVA